MGWGGAVNDEDPRTTSGADPCRRLTSPPEAASTMAPIVALAQALAIHAARPLACRACSNVIPSQRATPLIPSVPNERPTSPVTSSVLVASSTVGVTKEEKAVEVAHRKGKSKEVHVAFSEPFFARI